MIRQAATQGDFARAGELIEEYIAWLPFDLGFQDFKSELADLNGHYSAPAGALFLAFDESVESVEAIGTVGIRALQPDVAELKRMYVLQVGRGLGLGRQLAERAVLFARDAGYRSIRLDSDQASMPEANKLYESLGFVDIPGHRANDLPCARFMELQL